MLPQLWCTAWESLQISQLRVELWESAIIALSLAVELHVVRLSLLAAPLQGVSFFLMRKFESRES